MEFKKVSVPTKGIKIVAEDNGRVVGRASLYLIYNDLVLLVFISHAWLLIF